MKKIIIAVLLLATLIHANLVDDGLKYYNNGNYKKAVKLWKKAAEQGDDAAQYNLGVMYDEGQGVRQDYKEAVKWYKKAAKQGNGIAQINLGAMYYYGKGVRQDNSKAKELFQRACHNGYKDGCRDYMYVIFNAQGVK